MVSVILTAYKGEKYIDRALRSVLSQTFQDYEILIVDEYGKDSVGSKAQSFKDGRIKYFCKSDEGPGAAVAFGITKSSYEYIAIFEQDDHWFEDKLEKQIVFLNSNPDVALVSTDWCDGESIPEERFSALSRYSYTDNGNPFEYLLKENFIATSSVVMRKKAVLSVAYPSAALYQGPWDRQLWLRLAYRYPIKVIREVLLWKYTNPTTLFNRQNYAALQYTGWVEALHYFKGISPAYERQIRHNIARSSYYAARFHLSNDNYSLFKGCIREATRYDMNYTIRQPYSCLFVLPVKIISILKKSKKYAYSGFIGQSIQ